MCKCGTTGAGRVIRWSHCTRAAPEWIPARCPNVEAPSQHFQVYTPEQRGHGHTPDAEGPITFELMAQDTITFIETVIGGPVHVLGCSDGAILALTIALRRPDLVRRLVFAAGVFHRDGGKTGSSTASRRISSGRATARSHPTESATTT